MAQVLAPPTFSERLLGVKGSSLVPVKGSKASRKEKDKGDAVGENPVARLKLLLIASFTTLHILNLITPLAPNYGGHDNRHASTPGTLSLTSSGVQDGPVGARKVDIMEKGVKSALDALALAVGAKVDDDDVLDGDEQKKLLVKVSPPIWIRVIPSPDLVATGSHSHSPSSHYPTLEMFMSSWTRLVGDPVFSKWIVVALALSISLNGYLLKGIAAGLGLGLGLVRKEGDGVRFSDGETENVVQVVEKDNSAVKKTTKSGRQAGAVPTFTLEDVDRRLELKANTVGSLRKRRGTVGPLSPVMTTPEPTPPAPTPYVTASPSVIVPSTPALPPPPPIDDSEHIHGAELVVRNLKECIDIYENGPRPASLALDMLNDEEVVMLAQNGKIAAYALEKVLGGERLERAVRIRRALVCEFHPFLSLSFGWVLIAVAIVARASRTQTLENSDVPMSHYDYSRVLGACCENVVGYIPLPLGIAGPLNVDGNLYPIPMATAEVWFFNHSSIFLSLYHKYTGHTRRIHLSRMQSSQLGRRRNYRAHQRWHDTWTSYRFPIHHDGRRRQSLDRK